jgi:hypothetical protein
MQRPLDPCYFILVGINVSRDGKNRREIDWFHGIKKGMETAFYQQETMVIQKNLE